MLIQLQADIQTDWHTDQERATERGGRERQIETDRQTDTYKQTDTI